MTIAHKTLLTSLIWAMVGVLSWYISICIFNLNVLRPVFSVSNIALITAPFHSEIVNNLTRDMIFHFPDYCLAALFTAILTYWFGYRKIFLVAFIIGATFIKIYISITDLIAYIDYYSILPPWVLWWFCLNMLFVFVLLPLSVYLGSKLGNGIKQKFLFPKILS